MGFMYIPHRPRSAPTPPPSPLRAWHVVHPLVVKISSPFWGSPGWSIYRMKNKKAIRSAISVLSIFSGKIPLSLIFSNISGAWFHIEATNSPPVMDTMGIRLRSGASLPPSSHMAWHLIQFLEKKTLHPSLASPGSRYASMEYFSELRYSMRSAISPFLKSGHGIFFILIFSAISGA